MVAAGAEEARCEAKCTASTEAACNLLKKPLIPTTAAGKRLMGCTVKSGGTNANCAGAVSSATCTTASTAGGVTGTQNECEWKDSCTAAPGSATGSTPATSTNTCQYARGNFYACKWTTPGNAGGSCVYEETNAWADAQGYKSLASCSATKVHADSCTTHAGQGTICGVGNTGVTNKAASCCPEAAKKDDEVDGDTMVMVIGAVGGLVGLVVLYYIFTSMCGGTSERGGGGGSVQMQSNSGSGSGSGNNAGPVYGQAPNDFKPNNALQEGIQIRQPTDITEQHTEQNEMFQQHVDEESAKAW